VEDYLKGERGLRAIRMLVEGCSVRTVERLTEIRLQSLLQLLVIAGRRCEALMDRISGVRAQEVQCDEIWGYVGKKEGHKKRDEYEDESIGDAWCWVALESRTKLALAFAVGKRTLDKAFELMLKVRRATSEKSRFQRERYVNPIL
jgi:hypothetical protein